MSFLSEAARLIRDAQARKRNDERGREELALRSMQALEEIAARSSTSQQGAVE